MDQATASTMMTTTTAVDIWIAGEEVDEEEAAAVPGIVFLPKLNSSC